MSNSLLEYVLSLGSCVLYHDYRRGYFRDLSGQGNHGTATGQWTRTRRGHAYHTGALAGGGKVTVADAASLRLTTGTLITFAKFKDHDANGRRIISKRDAAGIEYELVYNAPSGIVLVTTGASSVVTGGTPLNGKMMVGTSFVSGQIPKAYVEGAYLGPYNTSISFSADDAPLYLGGLYAAGYALEAPTWANLIFNAELTSTQIGRIFELFMLGAKPDMIDKRRSRVSVPKSYKSSLVLQLDIGARAAASIPDRSGSGLLASIVQPFHVSEGVFDAAMELHGLNAGSGGISVAAAASINTLPNITISAWVRPDSSGGGTAGYIVAKTQWAVYNYAGLSWAMNTAYTGAGAGWTWPLNAAYGIPYHLCITHARAVVNTAPKVYINGTEVTVTQIASGSGTLANDAAYALTVGASAMGTSGHDGLIEDVRIHNEVLSAAQVRALYLEGARRPTLYTPRFAYPVSPAAVGAGGKVGPWEVLSGTHTWNDDGTTRGLVCTTAGALALQQRRAFGGFYFRAKKAADGNVLDLHLMASVKGTGGSGYTVRIGSDESVSLRRWTSGASAATVFTSAAAYAAVGTEYELWLTRTVAGAFALQIKGGAYTTWTSVGTGTDTTHTTSAWTVADLDAADEVREVRHFVGDMTPAEAESMGLLAAA